MIHIQLEKDIGKYENVVNSSESFYKNVETVEIRGKTYEFYIYNYRLADVDDFIEFSPISFEMRGITFSDRGDLFPSIHKIFNHKENKLVEDDIEDETFEIKEKVDGSLIQPVVIDDEIIFKTKSTFKSEQSYRAKEILDKNDTLKKFILDCFKVYNVIPFFEYISFDNQIVVQYDRRDLVLIQLRSLENGKYLDYETLSKLAQQYKINYVNIERDSFKNILEKREKLENIEGWVIQNSDNTQKYTDFRKVKTIWYLKLHRVVSCDKMSEDTIIEMILDETIDDVLSALQESEKKRYIENIVHFLNHYIRKNSEEIKRIYDNDFELYKQNPRLFVEKYRNYDLFPVLMKIIRHGYNENTLVNEMKSLIKKRTNRLSSAREFLRNISLS